MKNIALAAMVSVLATGAFAGNVEPVELEPVVVVEETTSSAGGILVPLLALILIAAAAS